MSDTAPVISDEAVEAATKAYNAKKMHTNMSGDAQRYDMTAALSAAYPFLLAQITEGAAVAIGESAWEQGSSREPLAGDDEETWMRGANAGIDFAQTVTRAYGKATS